MLHIYIYENLKLVFLNSQQSKTSTKLASQAHRWPSDKSNTVLFFEKSVKVHKYRVHFHSIRVRESNSSRTNLCKYSSNSLLVRCLKRSDILCPNVRGNTNLQHQFYFIHQGASVEVVIIILRSFCTFCTTVPEFCAPPPQSTKEQFKRSSSYTHPFSFTTRKDWKYSKPVCVRLNATEECG